MACRQTIDAIEKQLQQPDNRRFNTYIHVLTPKGWKHLRCIPDMSTIYPKIQRQEISPGGSILDVFPIRLPKIMITAV
jgi:hypothetical protein